MITAPGRQVTLLFLAMANLATNPVEVFGLPEHRIVTVGSYIDF